MSLYVPWSITVAGRPANERMNDFVESIECSGRDGGSADTARLTFSMAGPKVIPRAGQLITISFYGRLRFKGYTDEPTVVVSRGGGKQIEVTAKGFDKTGKIKEKQRAHKDDCTLEDFLKDCAKRAGLSGIKVAPELAKIKRKNWNTRGRNFLALGQSLADELGGLFKVQGDQAVFAQRGAGQGPGGGLTPTVRAVYGRNLRTARLTPNVPRADFAKAEALWYDRDEAKWKRKNVEIGPRLGAGAGGGGGVTDRVGEARPDADSAERAAKGRKTEAEREGGNGSVEIELDVSAEVGGTCVVAGVGGGVDGPYRIERWTDVVTRKGAETTLELKQPQGEGGSSGGQ